MNKIKIKKLNHSELRLSKNTIQACDWSIDVQACDWLIEINLIIDLNLSFIHKKCIKIRLASKHRRLITLGAR